MRIILFVFYNIILFLIFPFFIILSTLLVLIKDKRSVGFLDKIFPFTFKRLHRSGKETGGIWIHAVSLGELRASVNFIKLLRNRVNKPIYVSVTTKTGFDFADSFYKNDKNIYVFYFPYDFHFSIGRILRIIKPSLFISIETEIWPNLFNILGKRNIPVIILNARISDSSYRNYLYFRFFFKYVFEKIDLALCISEQYRLKFLNLGIKKENIHKTGNMKFDLNIVDMAVDMDDKGQSLKRIFNKGKIIVAGSTHKGEESLILNSVSELNKSRKDENIFLFIAPRHPERFGEVYSLIKNYAKDHDMNYCRLSSIYSSGYNTDNKPGTIVVLVDMLGELLAIYGICDVAFVGGSMVDAGGHNILEPLFFGKPVVFGKHVENFLEIAGEILEIKAGKIAKTPKDLYNALIEYLYDENAVKEANKRGLDLISQNRGSSLKNLNYIMNYIK